MLVLALAALAFGACTDLNSGIAGSVIDAHVVRVIATDSRTFPGAERSQPYQRLELELDGSLFRGERVEVEWGGVRALNAGGLLHPGDRVLLTVVREGDARTYAIQEVVRLPSLLPLAALLVVALLAVARMRGLAALTGLAASIAVFLLAIVPALQRGDDPLIATVLGSIAV
ncbi:MAG: YibE/F family protein, partial [Chloroflexota bacterium]